MRILIDNSGYDLKNMGDVAMLQVAVERFGQFLPGWDIDVVTKSPGSLEKFCPTATPVEVDVEGLNAFLGWKMLGRLHKLPSGILRDSVIGLERQLRSTSPAKTARRLAIRFRSTSFPRESVMKFADQVAGVDAIVASGGGYITDPFSKHAKNILSLLAIGSASGLPTAMFGQGLGPIVDPALFSAAQGMRRFDMIALRERRSGPPLLDKLGVARSRWRVTGDDAIELAYRCRPSNLGEYLGVNLRISYYSGVAEDFARSILDVLAQISHELGTVTIPVPISFYQEESDIVNVIQFADIPDHEACSARMIDSPDGVARQAGRCRVIVTGSYHAGVFALSQGCSVVGVAANAYYADKFLGLQEQFPAGCTTVMIDDADSLEKLRKTVIQSWQNAPQVRGMLLERASDQIEESRSAYREWCQYVKEQ